MIKELEKNFTGRGEVKDSDFNQLEASKHAFIYEIDSGTHYEVFERKTVPMLKDFENRIYSDTDFKVRYPKSKDFGIWAWCISNKQKAINKFNSINMKTIIIIAILILGLSGCQKNKEYCFECTETITIKDSYSITTTHCGITEDEASMIEMIGTWEIKGCDHKTNCVKK